MFYELFQNKEKFFIFYYTLVFIFIFIIFNISFVTEEVCIFICFFGILNLLSIALINFARQTLHFKWQKTVLWFFSKFSFLFLIAFIANTTTAIKTFFVFSFINFFSLIQNLNLRSILSLVKVEKNINLMSLLNLKNFNKFVLTNTSFLN